jgi:hypothetical protein
MSDIFAVGDKPKLVAVFKANGNLTNPTALQLQIETPSGALTPVTSGFENPQTGEYKYPVEFTVAGAWRYKWSGTGACHASHPWQNIEVRA